MPQSAELTLAGRPVHDLWAKFDIQLGRRPPGGAIIAEADLIDVDEAVLACSPYGVEPPVLSGYAASITFRGRKRDGSTQIKHQAVLVKVGELPALCAFVAEQRVRLYGELPFCQPS